MRDKLFQASTPGKPLMIGACRLVILGFDTHRIEVVDEFLCTEHLVHAFCSTHHEEVVDLLVELVGTCEDTVVGSLEVEPEDGTAEGSHVRELIQ